MFSTCVGKEINVERNSKYVTLCESMHCLVEFMRMVGDINSNWWKGAKRMWSKNEEWTSLLKGARTIHGLLCLPMDRLVENWGLRWTSHKWNQRAFYFLPNTLGYCQIFVLLFMSTSKRSYLSLQEGWHGYPSFVIYWGSEIDKFIKTVKFCRFLWKWGKYRGLCHRLLWALSYKTFVTCLPQFLPHEWNPINGYNY